MDTFDVANVAAILEDKHDSLNNKVFGDALDAIGLPGYTVVSTGTFPGEPYTKAITVKDANGNMFVHFYGTGDGNWEYNAAAYGAQPQPSDMQNWALAYFDETVRLHYEGKSLNDLYVSGHSQGGNSGQFVTIRSKYGDYISSCVSIDAPGFSYRFPDDSKALYGEAYYENQRGKIWAYNGENDFVSILGQVSIIDDGQVRYVKYTGEGLDFILFHMAAGLLDENGRMSLLADDTKFRKYLINALDKVKELPPEEQARTAELVMMLCEDFVGAQDPVKSNMTSQEFDELKQLLAPLLVDILADHPEDIVPVLQEFGMDKHTAESIANLIEHINTYPPEVREQIIAGFLDLVKYENGQFTVDTSKIPTAILTAWPVILETALTHPSDIMTILHEIGVDAAIGSWIKEHPWQFVGIYFGLAVLSPIWAPIASAVAIVGSLFVQAGLLMDAGIRIVQGIAGLTGKIRDGIVTIFNALKNAITAFAKWFRSTFNAGVRYAANHPYIKVDTGQLRSYADRINRVNSRLSRLDGGLRGLYWQVGLLDLWDILCANLLTSGSPTLNQVKSYLNNTADRFETAENKARERVGG
ncbi:MAG: DUF2974 domain-containing protein [Oscillospiraceae bacterium]|jgi:hypothetical protein|nr:DUF2974 domain-containing protein [Oscillospiraceae bacterium]